MLSVAVSIVQDGSSGYETERESERERERERESERKTERQKERRWLMTAAVE